MMWRVRASTAVSQDSRHKKFYAGVVPKPPTAGRTSFFSAEWLCRMVADVVVKAAAMDALHQQFTQIKP
jgi:hypothetical protein